jgi:hypothetical protein
LKNHVTTPRGGLQMRFIAQILRLFKGLNYELRALKNYRTTLRGGLEMPFRSAVFALIQRPQL